MSHNVLIVLDRDTNGLTTFKRSYIATHDFEKIMNDNTHIGFQIPGGAIMNDVADNCNGDDEIFKQCIAIKPKPNDAELAVIKNPAFIVAK
jgi:hypothetical protein